MSSQVDPCINVYVMDLLCMAPYYDRYLCEHLKQVNRNTKLGAISFHLDIGYFSRHGLRTDPGFLDCVSKLRVKNRRVRQLLKGTEYLLNLVALAIRFLVEPPDVLHTQWLPLLGRAPFEWWLLRLLRARGVKLVHTVHNVLPHDTGDAYRGPYVRLYRLADILICHTDGTKRTLVEDFGIDPDKVRVIPHGPLFYDYPAPPDPRALLGVAATSRIVLLQGIMRPYKGIEFLLQAWAQVVQLAPEAVLILAGHGEQAYLEGIRRMITELGLGGSVRTDFRFIATEELSTYFKAADILVYPYRDITQSGALLTGMCFGKPIVATDCGGFKETITEGYNGRLVKYGDATGLADTLIKLLAAPQECDRLGAANLHELEAKYSWQTIARHTVEAYQNACDHSPPRVEG